MSLRVLAKKVNLTASFLSQLERGQTDPSIKSLRRIADALGVPMLSFLDESKEPNPVVRKDRRKKLVLPDSRVIYELLTPDLDRKMEMFIARVHPRQQNIVHPLPYPTEECILVLEGCLRIKLGENEYELEAGDSIYFECSGLCSLFAVGDEPAVFVSAMTPAVF
jgi:transcriptional regulator with XRE-family HTH domain